MTTEPTVSDVLRKAAEILAEKGHCKGEFEDEQSRVCMWGAIVTASGHRINGPYLTPQAWNDPVVKKVARLVHSGGLDGRDIDCWPGAEWNDAPERTGTEVEKFLIGLADKAEFGE